MDDGEAGVRGGGRAAPHLLWALHPGRLGGHLHPAHLPLKQRELVNRGVGRLAVCEPFNPILRAMLCATKYCLWITVQAPNKVESFISVPNLIFLITPGKQTENQQLF